MIPCRISFTTCKENTCTTDGACVRTVYSYSLRVSVVRSFSFLIPLPPNIYVHQDVAVGTNIMVH